MIKTITVTNHLGESLVLDLQRPDLSGLAIQDITGLGPCKANINMTELSTTDGSSYNSARLNSRNIVLTLKYLWNPTVEASRQLSYQYFPVKKRIALTIETDYRTCTAYGYVESNDPVIFSNNSVTTISIICPDPYFYSIAGTTVTVFSAVVPEFEFPFSNESLVGPLLVMSELVLEQTQNIPYAGDSEVGVLVYIHAFGTVENLLISNSLTGETMLIDTDRLTTLTGHAIIAGDDIIISTMKGNKYITLIRDAVEINIINCIDRDSQWFQITRGDNVFGYTADIGATLLYFRIENSIIYEGV
jgi:hypothetical protein